MRNFSLTRRRYKKDLKVIIALIILPLLMYLHNVIPDVKSYDFILFKLDSNYYKSLQIWFWVISIKLVFIITYIIWFSTCRYWWRNVLLVPLIYFITQLFYALNTELRFGDKNEIFYKNEIFVEFLISLPIVFVIFIVTKKMRYHSKPKSLNDALDSEINAVMEELSNFKVEDYKNIKFEYDNLINKKQQLDEEVYLSKLIMLREQLQNL